MYEDRATVIVTDNILTFKSVTRRGQEDDWSDCDDAVESIDYFNSLEPFNQTNSITAIIYL